MCTVGDRIQVAIALVAEVTASQDTGAWPSSDVLVENNSTSRIESAKSDLVPHMTTGYPSGFMLHKVHQTCNFIG